MTDFNKGRGVSQCNAP